MASENLDKRFELIQETFSNPEFKTNLIFNEFFREHETILDKNISNINYRVKWNDNNVHWMSIDLGTEAHSWCL